MRCGNEPHRKAGHLTSTRIGKAVRIDVTKVRPLDQADLEALATEAQKRGERARR
jgi:hypothetical protein